MRQFYKVPPGEWLLTANEKVSSAQQKALAKPTIAEREIEEYVRQWILRELVQSYDYPEEWLGSRIVLDESPDPGIMQAKIILKNGLD